MPCRASSGLAPPSDCALRFFFGMALLAAQCQAMPETRQGKRLARFCVPAIRFFFFVTEQNRTECGRRGEASRFASSSAGLAIALPRFFWLLAFGKAQKRRGFAPRAREASGLAWHGGAKQCQSEQKKKRSARIETNRRQKRQSERLPCASAQRQGKEPSRSEEARAAFAVAEQRGKKNKIDAWG